MLRISSVVEKDECKPVVKVRVVQSPFRQFSLVVVAETTVLVRCVLQETYIEVDVDEPM